MTSRAIQHYPQRSTSEPLLYVLNQDCKQGDEYLHSQVKLAITKESKVLYMQLLLRYIR